MGRIVYCAWLIPCDYRVQLVHNPAQLLGGGRRVVCFVLTLVRAKLALGPVRSWFTRRVSDRATQHKNHSFVVYTRVDPSVIITFVIESGSPVPPPRRPGFSMLMVLESAVRAGTPLPALRGRGLCPWSRPSGLAGRSTNRTSYPVHIP